MADPGRSSIGSIGHGPELTNFRARRAGGLTSHSLTRGPRHQYLSRHHHLQIPVEDHLRGLQQTLHDLHVDPTICMITGTIDWECTGQQVPSVPRRM